MKILILSASTGGGHMRAAAALKSYINENGKNNKVQIIDTLEYINPLLNKTVTEGYKQIIKKVPKLFSTLYNSTNQDKALGAFLSRFMSFISRSLLPLINEFNPDIIITTHPFATEMISILKEYGKTDKPLMCIMTDYTPHLTWINKCVDSYIVASESMVDMMVKMGAPREKIHPFGIPIDDSFYTHEDKSAILKEIDLNPGVHTILIMAGSFGVNDILKIYDSICKIPLNFQTIIITGKNQKLYNAFEKRIKSDESLSKPVKLLCFTNEVYKYMKVSDLIITKPGGLTVSEALACNLPMAVFDAIPGQEEGNAEFLIDNNMAIKIDKDKTCALTIESLLKNGETLQNMQKSCRSFDKSSSGKNILIEINNLMERGAL